MLLLAVGMSLLIPNAFSQDYTAIILTVEVFQDGSTSVEYTVEPDPTLATVNVTLFGEDYVDLLAIDQDGIILDWSIFPGGLEVDSLGSDEITVSYSRRLRDS